VAGVLPVQHPHSRETGTGKELAVWELRRHSVRAEGPFIAVNCAALPAELAESELFGYAKGAHSTAREDKSGCFEQPMGDPLPR